MESITKNTKTRKQIMAMLNKWCPNAGIETIEELKGGYFNVAYEIHLSNGQDVILKIAPSKDTLIMSYETNIMQSEVQAMEIIERQTSLPIPQVYFYDNSCTVCDAPYFIMEKLKGKSFDTVKHELAQEIVAKIEYKAGEMTRRINQVEGEYFGYISYPKYQGNDWYAIFYSMIELAIEDAERMEIDLKVDKSEILRGLEEEKESFKEVKVPHLVHWDLWDGNLFVKNGKITGIIDWERSLFGDPLMEVGFRSFWQDPDYLRGYGVIKYSESQRRRIRWYDIYLCILMALEYKYRQYPTTESYEWATGMLCKLLNNALQKN